MSSDESDLKNLLTRAVINFFYPARQVAEEISRYSDRNSREALQEEGLEMPERRTKKSMVPSSGLNFELFQCDPSDILWRLVTMDITCLYHYNSEIKQQSMEWRHSGSHRPPKIPSSKIRWKILVSVF